MSVHERIIAAGGPHRFAIGDQVSWWGQEGRVISLTVEPSVTVEFADETRLTVGQSTLQPATNGENT